MIDHCIIYLSVMCYATSSFSPLLSILSIYIYIYLYCPECGPFLFFQSLELQTLLSVVAVAVVAYVIQSGQVRAVFPPMRTIDFLPAKKEGGTALSLSPSPLQFSPFLRERESREWLLEVD